MKENNTVEDQSLETGKGKRGVEMRKGVTSDTEGSPHSPSFISISPEYFPDHMK
jgi:hypothetical protein